MMGTTIVNDIWRSARRYLLCIARLLVQIIQFFIKRQLQAAGWVRPQPIQQEIPLYGTKYGTAPISVFK
jgi:hypothetical protein